MNFSKLTVRILQIELDCTGRGSGSTADLSVLILKPMWQVDTRTMDIAGHRIANRFACGFEHIGDDDSAVRQSQGASDSVEQVFRIAILETNRQTGRVGYSPAILGCPRRTGGLDHQNPQAIPLTKVSTNRTVRSPVIVIPTKDKAISTPRD